MIEPRKCFECGRTIFPITIGGQVFQYEDYQYAIPHTRLRCSKFSDGVAN